MAIRRVRHIEALYDFIGLVVLEAPDRFRRQDFLAEEDQLNLDRAFEELRHGITFVERDFPGADQQRGLSAALDRSLAFYRSGDRLRGAHALQDFQDLIFKTE
jgi:hypothetical protein